MRGTDGESHSPHSVTMLDWLPTPQEEEAEVCLRSFTAFAQRAWPVVEEDTPLLWEPQVHTVIALHVEVLIVDFARAKLFQLAQGHAHGELPQVSTARLPFATAERRMVERERARVCHLRATARRLEVLLASGRVEMRPQRFTNLLVNVGPGYGKSRLCSVLAPAWLWLLWPSAWTYAFSINSTGAASDAGRQRDLLRSEWFQRTFRPWWGLHPEKDAETNYRNTAGGGRRAVGWGAKVGGERGHLQLIDDPEDQEQVFSDGQRLSTKRAWDGRISKRVHPGGTSIRLATQQALHEDDWSRHVLKTGQWEHLELPTEAPDTPSPCSCATHLRGHTALGWREGQPWEYAPGKVLPARRPGELLAPRLVPTRDVEARKANPSIYAAQDQQRPPKLSGNVFPAEKWRYWRFEDEDAVPEFAGRTLIIPGRRADGLEGRASWIEYFDDRILTGDLSFGVSQDGSWDCLGAWGKRGPNRFLLDVEWAPLSFTGARAAVRALCARVPGLGYKGIELAANGSAVIDSLTEGAEALRQEPIEGIVPLLTGRASKVYRAQTIQHLQHGGNLYLPLHHPQRPRMVAEAQAFPHPRMRNDFVDMTSHAQRHWQSHVEFSGGWASR